MKISANFKKRLIPIFAWALTGLIVLVTGWIGDGLKGDILFWVGLAPYKAWVIIALFAVWAGCAWLLERLWRYLLPLRTLSSQMKAKPHAVLIAPVSSSWLQIRKRGDAYWLVEEKKKEDGTVAVVLQAAFADGLENLLAMFEKANVAPLLRSLIRHQSELRQVHFLASPVSQAFAAEFAKALQTHKSAPGLAALESVTVHPKILNFEDIDEVYTELDGIAESALRSGMDESDIIVDLTGGQKPTSVALALYTLHRNIRCQYVQTSEPFDVLQYDMAFQPAKRD